MTKRVTKTPRDLQYAEFLTVLDHYQAAMIQHGEGSAQAEMARTDLLAQLQQPTATGKVSQPVDKETVA